ncbi:MAG: PDGLE domain-containing protein [Candidatus Bathyarchaeia archaeon]
MKGFTKAIMLIIMGLVVLIPLASTHPDGLERVAESLGIEESQPIWGGLMPDYTFPLTEDPYITKLVSGLIGLSLVLCLAWGVGWVITRRDRVQE